MENTIGINDAAMEDPIPIEKKNNTDAEETDMTEKKINTAAIKETEPEADNVKLVESAYIYLTKREYPLGCTKNEKRSIRRKAERLHVQDGILHYKKKNGSKVCIPMFSFKLIFKC